MVDMHLGIGQQDRELGARIGDPVAGQHLLARSEELPLAVEQAGVDQAIGEVEEALRDRQAAQLVQGQAQALGVVVA